MLFVFMLDHLNVEAAVLLRWPWCKVQL